MLSIKYCSSLYVSAALCVFTYVLATFVGLVVFAYYVHIGCDPLASHQIENADQVNQMPINVNLPE